MPQRDEELAQALLRRIGRARKNPARFFEFAVKEETSRQRIKTLPHQELIFKFVMHYPKCVVRMPVGFSKTYTMAALSMFLLGQDPTVRGAIVSATQGQAKKPLAMVKDHIESSPELKAVFPGLRPSRRSSDPWTQSSITVDRPAGIRDASLTAIGVHGALPGSRLNWLLVDDILSEGNTNSPEQRDMVAKWFLSTVLARRDLEGSRIVVTNTPWHPEDLTYRLEKAGWPTLTMSIEGDIIFENADDFDCDDIRPSEVNAEAERLTANDNALWDPELDHIPANDRHAASPEGFYDREDVVPLWPAKFNRTAIDSLKQDYADDMTQYYQLYEMKCRSDEDSKVKTAWIEQCKSNARDLGIHTFTQSWTEGKTFTGVDLAIGKKKKNDKSAIFTMGLHPDKKRRILRIDEGQWSGSEIINRLIDHRDNYQSIIRVETNAAQDFLRQWALERDASLPIRKHHTGANKHSREHGIESLFIEVENGSWLIPNDPSGRVPKEAQQFIDGMLYYNPDGHTADVLIAAWLARLQAYETGALRSRNGRRAGQATPMRQLSQMNASR